MEEKEYEPIVVRYATEEEETSKEKGLSAISKSEPKELILYGKPPAVTLSHEIAHFKLGHLRTSEDSPGQYVSDEIDAWRETYRSLGRPRSLQKRFFGIMEHSYETWGASPKVILVMLARKLGEPGTPKSWVKDLGIVREQLKSWGY